MAYTTISDWHRQSFSSSQKTTVSRVRYSFLNQEINDWAANNEVLDEVTLLADTFGASKAFSVVGNLSLEFSHPESEWILNDWSDDPIVAQLREVHSSYLASEEVQVRFPPFSQKGNAKRTAQAMRDLEADIQNRHFLLLMCVIPLAGHGSNEAYEERRRLRLWLIIQSAKRLKVLNCPSDKLISKASLYLAKDPHDKNWHCIDQLLGRTKQILQGKESNFRSFSLAIERSVLELKSEQQEKGAVSFLNAIAQIAAGDCVPITSHPTSKPGENRPSHNLFEANEFRFGNISSLGLGYQALEILPDSEGPDEDGQQALVFEVEPTDSPEEQKLSGRSIAIQSAELSHYLPWSLEKALPGEVDDLETWLNDTLGSNLFTEKLGAAMAWLAIRFSRSLAQVMQFQVSEAQQEEWALTPDFSAVHRQPPRRKNSWYPQNPRALASVAPFEEQLSFRLPDALRKTFLKAQELTHGSFTDLRAFWFGHASEPLETWFNTQTHGRFARLTSGKLANIQSQRVYDDFNDHSLARMISAQPRSALPAACGYWNWDISTVENGFALQLNHQHDQIQRETKLLGSVLAPLDSLLNQHIESANASLRNYSGDVIGYHNLLTQYTVTVLYAATGSRHLAEPFESASHFCPSPPAMFINDKSDGAIHNGRMVPLPEKAQSFFKTYTIHLAQLAVAIKDVRPELADDIKALPFGKTDRLPLFFLLDSTARWRPAPESGLPGGRLFNWPLPSNLFRHKYAQDLAREGVHPEVIDGWLGHGERGVGSYGDASPRCWLNDAQQYQEQTNTVFNRLPFRVQEPQKFPKLNAELDSRGTDYTEPHRFGQKERERKRRNQIKKAIKSARDEIRLFLGDRKLEELKSDQLDKLSNMMLLREIGLPHTQAAIRLSVLAKQIEKIRGAKAPKIKKRLLVFEQDRSLVNSTCPQALVTLRRLSEWFDIAKKNINVTKISKKEALTLAVVSLMVEKRLTYRRLLSDIARGENYRIIQHRKRLYLEYSENLEPDNWYAPVERHEIDYKTAALLNYGKELKSPFNTQKTAYSEKFKKLAILLAPQTDSETEPPPDSSVSWLVESVCAIVEQANLVELPGVIAAALSGRRLTTSVPILDHLRLTQGLNYHPPANLQASELPHYDPILTGVWQAHEVNERETLRHNAKIFFNELGEQLASYRKGNAIADANRIDRWCKKYPGIVSPAVKLVGHWIAGRILAGKGRKDARHKPYAPSTPKRYLTALSKCFRGLAYDSDLTLLDSDEITDLIEAMLEVTSDRLGVNAYSALRLVEFFKWAETMGVAEPHWEDLDLGAAMRSVKASLLSEEEYLQCLTVLSQLSNSYSSLIPMARFALMLGFRFGLRASEALGLRRKDWCEKDQLRWVLVRRNQLTSLKRPGSRRAVPLLFHLDTQEEMIIREVALRYESEFGENRQKHFLEAFSPSETAIKTHKSAIASMVNSVIKSVTGNPVISFHSTRHSLCTRLSPILLHHQGVLSDVLTADVDEEFIRQLALGPQCKVSRRSTMAMARLLGHSTPNTSLRTYNHALTDWADSLTPVKSMRIHRLPNAVQIEEWALRAPKETIDPDPIGSKASATEAIDIVRALRLMSIGRSSADIEIALDLEPTSISDLERLVETVNARMRFSVPDSESNEAIWVYGSDKPLVLLKKLSDSAWSRLLESAQSFPSTEHFNVQSPLPKIAEIENLVGRNGHLLMSRTEHYALVKLLIDSFEIPKDQFIARAKNDEVGQIDSLRRFGLLAAETDDVDSKAKPLLDTHKMQIGSELFNNKSYGGVILSPSSKGPIHNRHELVVALIAVAAYYCQRTLACESI